jgi:protein-disulfide isomerase
VSFLLLQGLPAQDVQHVYAPLINKSLKDGIDSGVEGTPTFFVNGVRYEDSWDLETFSSVLEKTLT